MKRNTKQTEELMEVLVTVEDNKLHQLLTLNLYKGYHVYMSNTKPNLAGRLEKNES